MTSDPPSLPKVFQSMEALQSCVGSIIHTLNSRWMPVHDRHGTRPLPGNDFAFLESAAKEICHAYNLCADITHQTSLMLTAPSHESPSGGELGQHTTEVPSEIGHIYRSLGQLGTLLCVIAEVVENQLQSFPQ